MNKKTWWEDDLKEAEAAGFHHEQDSNKPSLERGGNISLVHKNGITHIWTIRDGWQVAELIDGHFQNHRPQEELSEALKSLPKTLAGWNESKKALTSYLEVGDPVTMDIIDEMAGCVPPITFFNNKYREGAVQGCLQVGEPYNHDADGNPNYMTFHRTVKLTKASDYWRYVGIKPLWRD